MKSIVFVGMPTPGIPLRVTEVMGKVVICGRDICVDVAIMDMVVSDTGGGGAGTGVGGVGFGGAGAGSLGAAEVMVGG